MTAVVGLIDEGRVFMAADSAGVEGYSLVVRRDPKVFEVGPFVIGFTSSFRMGQLLRWSLRVPPRPADVLAEQWLATTFIDAVRDCLKAGGWQHRENERETGGTFLVGYQGRLFRVDDDLQIGENVDPWDAVGSAQDVLRAVMWATRDLGVDPTARLLLALEAAQRVSGVVRGPFNLAAEP